MSRNFWVKLPTSRQRTDHLNLELNMLDVERIHWLRRSGLLPATITKQLIAEGKKVSEKDVYRSLGFNV